MDVSVFLLELLALCVGAVRGASFYGDGFVQLKAEESSRHNTLHVRFRTSSQRGVLFLAAGQSDYLLLELTSGRLQAKLDLGSGERILHSDRGNPLNDLAWHTVDLAHDRYNVSLTVDKHFQISERLPAPQQELNIKDGLYVGGTGGLDKVYLPSDLTGFRGCLDEVLFNEHNLLSSLRPYSGLKNVYEVSLGCSPQFFANEEDPISFFSSRAYVSLPPWSAQQEWTLECSLHTSAQEGIIMYNSARQGDFVSVEIQEGLLVAAVGRDGIKTELRSLTFINDKRWHSVKLYFTSKSLQLTIDGENVKSIISSRSKTLQLKGYLFLGGVDDSTRSEVRKVGLSSVAGKRIKGGSFKGCFKDIKVNGVPTGLPNAVVTKDISVGCEPEKEPPEIATTLSPTTVPQTLVGSFTELPPLDVSTLAKGLVKKYGQNFLQLRNLVVPEGGRASLDSKHIKVNLEFKKLGIRQSQIMFRIEEQPVHGQLRFDVDPEQEENTFSMLDLWHSRVMYIHGGSEDPRDYFMFSVFSNSRKETPSYLKGHKLYRFNVTVTPTNDAPELSLPEGNLFILLENSKKKVTTDVLKAKDVDSNLSDLVYYVLGNLNADAGFLENEDNPGHAIASFPHSALEDGKINYVHTGVRNSRIVLRVSDGEKVSNTVVLRIMAIALEHSIVNNTGLEVTQGEMALIGTTQLAVRTNAVKQVVEIRYDVIEPARFGELQRLHSSGEWKFTNSFSQRVLEKDRLRYLSTFEGVQSGNVTDRFKCKVTIGAAATTEQLEFAIKIKWVNYTVERNEMIEMDKIRRVAIDSQHLYATAQGVILAEDELYFRIMTLTEKGMILLNNEKLQENSTFSQMDITNLKVEYQLVDRPYKDTSDQFEFQVFSRHAHSARHVFKISIKADVNSIYIRNKGLSILEGESKLIIKDDLFAESLVTKEMYYSVTKSPKHGKLARINLSNSTKDYDRLVSFTSQDILEERLMYVHDGSETTQDQFTFIASISPTQVKTSVIDDEEVGSKEGVFNISIQLVNDEKPVRVVDKVFHVVRDGQRLLTLDDLCYHDADSNFSDGQLVYTRRGIPMGDLVLVNDTSHKLYQFTQEDLEQKRVLFIHRGVSSGRFVLFVSDGKHYVSSLLDIIAQDPYLRIDNNTGLLVQKGLAKTFSPANLSVVTNLDIREDSEVTFKVKDAPQHGGLFLKDEKVESFSQLDLKSGLLSYRHDNSKNLADFFTITAKAKGLRLDARVSVKVYLESHQKPPVILQNKTLFVEEGKPVKIQRSKLEVTHEANLPSEIVFTVKVAPAYGYLRGVVDDQYRGTEEKPLMNFTQQDINDGALQYVQTTPDQVNDSLLLDASNGVADVSDITLSVDIIPRFIPVKVSNITLKEGASKALTEKTIRVSNQHFTGLHFVYYVSEGPMHGRIENSRFPGIPTTYFTRKQVEQEFIYYVHDNSETLEDHFTVIANDTELQKYSTPRTVYIQIIPTNDEPPVITANKVLRVWVGSITEITPEDMNAEDDDTPPDQLNYITTQPSNGHLALKSAPTKPIMNFTQAHIDQSQLIFVHSGATAGGFNFQVNDGVNFAPRQIFSVTARALVLRLERNGPLKVFPGSLSTISKEDLRAVTNDDKSNTNRTIRFTVVNPPTLGKLVSVQADESLTEISSFTQEMLDKDEVAYEHTVGSVEWVSLDKITFTVSSPPASLDAQTFDIEISYENAGPERSSRLLKNTGAVVTEGDKVAIDKTMLDSSNLLTKEPEPRRNSYDVWYQVKSFPLHGIIVVGERNLTKEKPYFSQFILNKYGITYHHDNSETTNDRFVFDAFLNLKSKPAQRPLDDSEVVEEVFNITVIPVNDQPPVLKTKTPSLKVVQGDSVAIASSNLNVVDLDNAPEEILYSVISKPSNGFLALVESLNVSVDSFSQKQINNGEVFFVQDGTPASGVFYFSVTDGHHRPVYKLFNLEVMEISISLVNHTEVMLEQGRTSVDLTQVHLAAVTNGKNTTVHYKITVPPRHGKLLLDNEEADAFNQEDLQAHRLSYHMIDLMSSHDSFEFMVFTSEANLTDQIVNITVKPLVRYAENVGIPNGIRFKFKAAFLNASELASISDSDPQFEILSPPRYGKIIRKGNKAEQVRTFTFSELQQGRLAIEVKANLTEVQEVNDSFRFVLKAKNLQPAIGEFPFKIVPYDPSLMMTMTTTAIIPAYTTTTLFPSQTTAISSALLSISPTIQPTQRVTKPVTKFKGRNRWGNSNTHSDSQGTTTIVKPDRGPEITPGKNTPLRVESAPQGSSSNAALIILPLLALVLLIIVVVLVLLLRRKQQKKQKPCIKSASIPMSSSEGRSYQGHHSERSATVPLVTVTPLNPSNPGSPALMRLQTSSGNSAYGQSMALCSFGDQDLETSQFCRTTNPTLQHNQYWV